MGGEKMKRNILVVDDNKVNRALLCKILKDEYEVIEAVNGIDAVKTMKEYGDSLSAVLLDILMPKMDGYEVLSLMQQESQLKQIPVIVTTGNTDDGAEVKALSLGANDYITKPYNPDIIRHRLWNTINLRETAAVVNQAKYDDLTGIYNRKTFFSVVKDLVTSHESGYYVMACFDIDNFKVINDQYGNVKGDEVLQFIAHVFHDGFEKIGGVCCRVMADVFAVVYPKTYINSDLLMDIRQTVSNFDGSIMPITFSIGRYVIDDLSLSISGMFDRASLAEESVKGQYDVQVSMYDESLRQRLLREQEIINDMKSALHNENFEVWLQPQYNHASGALIGAEALVRWRHPQKGLISPGQFIPVFERNGFIYELDKYVLENTCKYLRKWIDQGRHVLPVSVNISRCDVFRPDLIDVINGFVKKYEIPIDLLRLEITESAFAKSTSQIVKVVKQLVGLGYTVEIDDFGSGYSSLNTLKNVPAHILKLDMKFLENEDDLSRGGSIIESVVRMAKWFGMSVIAEGVEKMEQADYLKTIGCNYIQGYLYSKPVPVEEYEIIANSVIKEERQMEFDKVETFDNNTFWNPSSMDTLLFNNYVGSASVFEYKDDKLELLKANDRFAKSLCGDEYTLDQVLNLKWENYMDPKSYVEMMDAIREAIKIGDDTRAIVAFHNLISSGRTVYLKSTFRAIAHTGDRYLIYCNVENVSQIKEDLGRFTYE